MTPEFIAQILKEFDKQQKIQLSPEGEKFVKYLRQLVEKYAPKASEVELPSTEKPSIPTPIPFAELKILINFLNKHLISKEAQNASFNEMISILAKEIGFDVLQLAKLNPDFSEKNLEEVYQDRENYKKLFLETHNLIKRLDNWDKWITIDNWVKLRTEKIKEIDAKYANQSTTKDREDRLLKERDSLNREIQAKSSELTEQHAKKAAAETKQNEFSNDRDGRAMAATDMSAGELRQAMDKITQIEKEILNLLPDKERVETKILQLNAQKESEKVFFAKQRDKEIHALGQEGDSEQRETMGMLKSDMSKPDSALKDSSYHHRPDFATSWTNLKTNYVQAHDSVNKMMETKVKEKDSTIVTESNVQGKIVDQFHGSYVKVMDTDMKYQQKMREEKKMREERSKKVEQQPKKTTPPKGTLASLSISSSEQFSGKPTSKDLIVNPEEEEKKKKGGGIGGILNPFRK